MINIQPFIDAIHAEYGEEWICKDFNDDISNKYTLIFVVNELNSAVFKCRWFLKKPSIEVLFMHIGNR